MVADVDRKEGRTSEKNLDTIAAPVYLRRSSVVPGNTSGTRADRAAEFREEGNEAEKSSHCF